VTTTDRTCLSYWFPLLQATGARVPRTTIVTTTLPLYMIPYGEGVPGYVRFRDEVRAACDAMGYPCFLRTGYGSGKHAWRDTCYIEGPDKLDRHIYELLEWSGTVDLVGLPVNVWAVREFLRLRAGFTAFRSMPVATEYRFFCDGGRVVCSHPYWPPESIRGPSCADWRAVLAAQSVMPPPGDLGREVARVADAFAAPGYWSMDWALTVGGEWYAIDMADGARSFHWPGCGVPRRVARAE